MQNQAYSSRNETSDLRPENSAPSSSFERQQNAKKTGSAENIMGSDGSALSDKDISEKGKGKARRSSEGESGVEKVEVSPTKAAQEALRTDIGTTSSLAPPPERHEVVEAEFSSNLATSNSAHIAPIGSQSTSSITPRPTVIARTESGSTSPALPSMYRKRRFSRPISQLSLSSFKSLSRPDTPVDSPLRSSSTMEEPDDYFSTGIGKTKGKFRQLFQFDSNKVSPRSSRPSTPLGDRINALKDSSLPSERISSRGRSHSAPVTFSSLTTSPSLLADSPVLPSVLDRQKNEASDDTPYHSAVSSPLIPCFPFETAPSSPVVETKVNLFDHYLPLELQVEVMRSLLEVCQEDWRREVESDVWKGAKARERWGDGEARGRRELAKIGRVSKSWRKLSLDGQLWSTAPSTSSIGADVLSTESIFSLFDQSGTFVKTLDLRGFGKSLEGTSLHRIIQGATAFQVDGTTSFTSIKLIGCNSLSSSSITSLLSHSPHLVKLNLFALPQIVSTHLSDLGLHCPNLTSLNVSRCRNLSAKSLLHLFPNLESGASTQNVRERRLESLKAAALTGMSDEVLFEIFTRNPLLSTLDISFSLHITDDAFKRISQSLVLPSSPSPTRKPSLLPSQSSQPLFTTSRQSSQSPSSPLTPAQKRSFPSLQHLNLSGCTSLTSLSLSHLTGSLPSLQSLELSRLPTSFDASQSLPQFLLSCLPTLRRLDLEDQSELTDETLLSLAGAKQLETLILNSCISLTDQAILEIVRSCEALKVLELDTTEVSDSTAKEFIRSSLERRQAQPQSQSQVRSTLIPSTTPTVLSLLDNRLTGRRLHREINQSIRPRLGYRGFWTGTAVGFYHDASPESEDEGGGLRECEDSKVVVRSFYSSLEVDAANAVRAIREKRRSEREKEKGRDGVQRKGRAMSDSTVYRTNGNGRSESLGSSTGCSVM